MATEKSETHHLNFDRDNITMLRCSFDTADVPDPLGSATYTMMQGNAPRRVNPTRDSMRKCAAAVIK